MSVIGIEIGGTKLQVVRGELSGRITERHRATVDPAAGAAGIQSEIARILATLLAATPARAIGVGFGGPVDRDRGRIACSHQVKGWSDFPISDWLGSLTGLPVILENDANTATLGEAHLGAGQGANPVFYVTLGSGVGGGLVVDGAVYHGMKPGEAEIGHLRLDRSGVIVEQRCSGWAVDRRIREAIQAEPGGALARRAAGLGRGEARHLAAAVAEQDPLAGRILSETAEDLAFALSHVVHLFHPEVIVLGGGLSLVGEPLRSAVAGMLPRFLMEVFHPGPRIALAALAEDPVPVGALLLTRGLLQDAR
ncbi:MAG TPA: sugar kinase [Verrucomicrobiales bacterium]|nr:sugar kinase [Verrucomicrobiales bacterium]